MANLKKTPGINAASMADISFILLIFFLLVTTMGAEFGLVRLLPPMSDRPDDEIKIRERNVLVVLVSSGNALMVNKEEMDIRLLRERAKDFFNIKNDRNDDKFPEKITMDQLATKRQAEAKKAGTTFREPEGAAKVLADKFKDLYINENAVISLQNDRGTSYKMYIQVQNELAAAVRELRDAFCRNEFGSNFDDCDADQQEFVGQRVYPMAISEAEPVDKTKKK